VPSANGGGTRNSQNFANKRSELDESLISTEAKRMKTIGRSTDVPTTAKSTKANETHGKNTLAKRTSVVYGKSTSTSTPSLQTHISPLWKVKQLQTNRKRIH
jgi:hypothetical protein